MLLLIRGPGLNVEFSCWRCEGEVTISSDTHKIAIGAGGPNGERVIVTPLVLCPHEGCRALTRIRGHAPEKAGIAAFPVSLTGIAPSGSGYQRGNVVVVRVTPTPDRAPKSRKRAPATPEFVAPEFFHAPTDE